MLQPTLSQPNTGLQLLTVSEARSKLRLGHTTIYRLLAEGKLRRVKLGAATRIPIDDVERLVREGVA